ncbi:MAG: hypothetical protein ACREYE_06030, partial [Gammaproteobacteria bacterium]
MRGQQFGRATIPLDTRQLNRVVSFDSTKGHIEAEAGIQWSELILYKQVIRSPEQSAKSRREDRVCLGGSLATSVDGRGLRFPPIINDVESFVLIGSQCWGSRNPWTARTRSIRCVRVQPPRIDPRGPRTGAAFRWSTPTAERR